MNKLITKSCEEIMTTLYKPIEFAVDGLITQGLYILAGSPKAGKSWLALQLCLAVAKGEKLFERETNGVQLCTFVSKMATSASKRDCTN